MKKNNLPIPTEKDECLMLAQYLQMKRLKFTHMSNERHTSVQHHMSLQSMGVSKGFPDYIIFIPADCTVWAYPSSMLYPSIYRFGFDVMAKCIPCRSKTGLKQAI
mgnify:CR=1 FL=1